MILVTFGKKSLSPSWLYLQFCLVYDHPESFTMNVAACLVVHMYVFPF
jgi:hypothetical protein